MLKLFGVRIDSLTKDELRNKLFAFRQSRGHMIATVNPEMLMEARENKDLQKALEQADLRLPDGFGVMLAAKYRGQALADRHPGIDIMSTLLAQAAKQQERVYLFGAKSGVAEKAAARLVKKHPGLQIVGAESGFRFWGIRLSDREMRDRIKRAKPDLLFVALGIPKQELWLAKNLPHLSSVKIAVGVGGAFDVFAGNVRRAPSFLRVIGLEWFWRLLVQPWRWQRIITATYRFSLAVIRAKE
ncbi:MAG: WecB/TagA/CpsF family glycosyltransferase [Candidatus Nomurabacteria bacterium]|nr:MAG: WecB/TagA/CpsF family glycosyltransferase [Candidatus Nomurabacteria bacterium]